MKVESGKELWCYQVNDNTIVRPVLEKDGLLIADYTAFSGVRGYANIKEEGMIALRVADGHEVWRRVGRGAQFDRGWDELLKNNLLAVHPQGDSHQYRQTAKKLGESAGSSSIGVSIFGGLAAISPETGTDVWKLPEDSQESTLLTNDHGTFVFHMLQVSKLNLPSGKLSWTFESSGGVKTAPSKFHNFNHYTASESTFAAEPLFTADFIILSSEPRDKDGKLIRSHDPWLSR